MHANRDQAAGRSVRLEGEWLGALWEEAPDGLRLTDAAGRIVAVNKAHCLMAGCSREQLLGQPFAIVYP
jgi:PAS domain S-box-containing protein